MRAPQTETGRKEFAVDCVSKHRAGGRAMGRLLAHSRRALRRYVKERESFNRLPQADRELEDRLAELEAFAWEAEREIRGETLLRTGADGLPEWYRFLQEGLNAPDVQPDAAWLQERMRQFEESRPMENAEYGWTGSFLRTAVLTALAQECETGEEREVQRQQRLRELLPLWDAVRKLDDSGEAEQENRLERQLCADPAGVYARQDVATRAAFRRKLACAAAKAGEGERELAAYCLAEASRRGITVGIPIQEQYEAAFPAPRWFRWYGWILNAGAGAAAFFLAWGAGSVLWAPLFWFLGREVLRQFLEERVLRRRAGEFLPRLELGERLPEDCPTLIVLSVLLPQGREQEEPDLEPLRGRLEELLLGCPEGPAGVCLLSDLPPADRERMPGDGAVLEKLRFLTEELNRRYEGRLLCLVRGRSCSETGGNYCGRERKRGAMLALADGISGRLDEFCMTCGSMERLRSVKYLLMLDYDTGLTLDALVRLVAAAEHPMNRPVQENGRIVSGYGILVPQMVPELISTMTSPFTRILCGAGGISSYGRNCPELYQALLGSTVFPGKGLVRAEYIRLTADLFLPETVLSHDMLEGGILRAGFVGDAELTEQVPQNAGAWAKRLHRWIRGDVQNLPFAIPGPSNPLSRAGRIPVRDNLLRALRPIAAVAAVLPAIWQSTGSGWLFCLTGILTAVWEDLFAALRGIGTQGMLWFYSGILRGPIEHLARAGWKLLLLPGMAWIAADAAIRGLWRRFVSHRRMLEWAPAAAVREPERRNSSANVTQGRIRRGMQGLLTDAGGVWGIWTLYGTSLIAGACLVLGRTPALLPGLLFLCSPLVLAASQIAGRSGVAGEEPLPESARVRILADIRAMLSYYEDQAVESEHWLPPDSLQTAPVYAVARRTSPTNIGMMLLAWLTARDCEIYTTGELFMRIGRVMDTLEQMETFHGNLYNWYDTGSLAVLPPAFVSTVDSGNLLCALAAVSEGLRAYAGEPGADPALPERVERYLRQADLRVCYRADRQLFSVGYDGVRQSLSESCYDMLMSEARMTSYFAIAQRQVPAVHWQKLSRAMARRGGRAGLLSWTGTLFEYYMPELLLHCRRGSLGWEALAYCLQCQKRRARQETARRRALLHGRIPPLPWGVSESGIYAFDAELNYQYRPNGIQALARKPGQDASYVVAPYASYLVLSRDWKGVLQNLDRLERLGARGRYGFYEAVDFTPERVGDSKSQVIHSFMAHHLGMAVTAAGNALCGNRMQRRFLRALELGRAKSLLEERIWPVSLPRHRQRTERREAMGRAADAGWEYVEHLNPRQPRVRILSNAGMASVLTDIGASFLMVRGREVIRKSSDLLRAPGGTFGFIRVQGDLFPLTLLPLGRTDVSYGAADRPDTVLYTAETDQFSAHTEVRLHRSLWGEQRRYRVTNNGTGSREMELLLCTELGAGLKIEYDTQAQAMVATPSPGTADSGPGGCVFVLGTGREETWELMEASDRRHGADTGNPSTLVPELTIGLRFFLAPGQTKICTWYSCAGETRGQALDVLEAFRRNAREFGEAVGVECAALPRLRPGSMAYRIQRLVQPQVLFGRRDTAESLRASACNELPASALERFGISPSLPLVVCEVFSERERERVTVYLACYGAMRLSFVPFTMAFLYDGRPAVRRMITEEIERCCAGEGGEGRGCVRILDRQEMTAPQLRLLRAIACHTASRSLIRLEAPAPPYRPLPVWDARPVVPDAGGMRRVSGGWTDGERFVSAPDRDWSYVLSNPAFGTRVTSRTLGVTWAVHAGYNRITPEPESPLSGGERLLLRQGECCWDLTAGASVEFGTTAVGRRTVCWRGEAGGIWYRVRLTVPDRGMAKFLDVALENRSGRARECRLAWYLEPCLAADRKQCRQIHVRREKGALLLQQPMNDKVPGWLALSADGEAFAAAVDRPQFLSGEWEPALPESDGPLPAVWDVCAALTVHRRLPAGSEVTLRFCMSFGARAGGALAQLRPGTADSAVAHMAVQALPEAVRWLAGELFHADIQARLEGRNPGARQLEEWLLDARAALRICPRTARYMLLHAAAVQLAEGGFPQEWSRTFGRGGIWCAGSCGTGEAALFCIAVSEYVDVSGDKGILGLRLPYLCRPLPQDGQAETAAMHAGHSTLRETMYGHGKRALSWALHQGREAASADDENCLAQALRHFSVICQASGEPELASKYRCDAGVLEESVCARAETAEQHAAASDNWPASPVWSIVGVEAGGAAERLGRYSRLLLEGEPDGEKRTVR